jgi:hypothetical protein
MSYSKDERDFYNQIWQVLVTLYDPSIDIHARLTIHCAKFETIVAKHDIDPRRHFPAIRRDHETSSPKATMARKMYSC